MIDASVSLYYSCGGLHMFSAMVSAEEQYKLIIECRQSGLSDQQWCLNHDIKPGTFYNWVKRLRQRGGYDIPAPAVQGVQFCSKLFEYERISKEKNHTHEQRKEYRLQKEKPILDAFWSWLDSQRPRKGSRFDKAVNYVQNRKPFLETYLEDGRCSFSNNLARIQSDHLP